jgi:hypothetical protein
LNVDMCADVDMDMDRVDMDTNMENWHRKIECWESTILMPKVNF